MLVRELLEQVPHGTKQVVQRTCERYRELIRDAIKQETRLVLHWGHGEGQESRSCTCPIRMDEVGYFEVVGEAEIPDGAEVAALLGYWRPSLESLAKGTAGTLRLLEEVGNGLNPVLEVGRALDSLERTDQLARRLLALLDETDFDVVQHILSVNEHVLGIFRFDPEEGWMDYKRRYSTEIHLYWGVIGFVSHAREWSTDTLTAAVLAHELAHAYTHLGFDRDIERWSGYGFARSENRLQEALAQYYADRALRRIGDRIPGAFAAYEALMPCQKEAYRAHLPWIEAFSPEVVGQTLSAVRRRGELSYPEFCDELGRVQAGLVGGSGK